MTTCEQIIAAAKESGFEVDYSSLRNREEIHVETWRITDEVEAFYAIAFEAGRQAEREECAAACMPHDDDDAMDRQAKAECCHAIRARSTK